MPQPERPLDASTCKHSIYDPRGVTRSCAFPLGHSGPHEVEAIIRCPICKEADGHSLSCPTRWYA